MSQFAAAFTQFFAALTVLFSAFSKGAQTIDNLASVAESASGTYKDQAIHDQLVAANKRKQELLDSSKTLAITQ